MMIAEEVKSYISKYITNLGRITFVAHSLGGVIVRAAICCEALQPYLSHLHTLVTLSSPHLGACYFSNNIVPGAIWFWHKWVPIFDTASTFLSGNSLCRQNLLS